MTDDVVAITVLGHVPSDRTAAAASTERSLMIWNEMCEDVILEAARKFDLVGASEVVAQSSAVEAEATAGKACVRSEIEFHGDILR
jgi:outer membrane lipopolysaccharide assembly protein LptE/RlpB